MNEKTNFKLAEKIKKSEMLIDRYGTPVQEARKIAQIRKTDSYNVISINRYRRGK